MSVVRSMVAHLRAENAELRERLRQYEDADGSPYALFVEMMQHRPRCRDLLVAGLRRLMGARPPPSPKGAADLRR